MTVMGRVRMTAGGMIAILVGCVGAGAAQEARPAADTTPAVAPPAVAVDSVIDAILSRLEERTVDDLTADLTWISTYAGGIEEEGESETKHGTIRYKAVQPVAKFAIHFTKKINDRVREVDDQHVFDGCWYIEVQAKTKHVSRIEVRKPTDPADPYKVGEGIFPMPFGQKKAEVLREFEIERREPASGDPADTDHLVLTPREGTRLASLYKTLDIWVARGGSVAGLPIQVKAGKKDGTGKLNQNITIKFSEPRLNTNFSEDVFTVKDPPGYEVDTQPLPPPEPPGAVGPPANGP